MYASYQIHQLIAHSLAGYFNPLRATKKSWKFSTSKRSIFICKRTIYGNFYLVRTHARAFNENSTLLPCCL